MSVVIETLYEPRDYTPAQIHLARRVAEALDRGKLIIVEPPAR